MKENCAGQQCPERDGCRRYESRIPARKVVIEDRKIPIFEWASFDIERQIFGDCPQRIGNHTASQRFQKRAA